MLRLVRILASALLAASAALLINAGPASAATYDGTNPETTGCANSAITAASATIRTSNGTVVGWIELRYSTSCRTTWARVTKSSNSLYCVSGDQGCANAEIYRNSDGLNYWCQTATGQNSCYTRQVNDANVTSRAYGDVDMGYEWPGAWTGSY